MKFFEKMRRGSAENRIVRRSPFGREWPFIILAAVLVISVFCGMFARVMIAADELSEADAIVMTGVTGRIEDRFGQPIYRDGEVSDYKVFGNLIGYKDRIHNSLVYRYSDLLTSAKINPILGLSSMEAESRVMHTTLLSEESQKELAKFFDTKSGCCFAYNYETGEVYTALSLPAYEPDAAGTTYINRCFDSTYIPGSTMKVVTAALAVDQGKNVTWTFYSCKGSYTLSNGDKINCTGTHGWLDFAGAIGRSCNCYFAQLIEDLNLDQALETLEELGFSVNKEEGKKGALDRLIKAGSTANITNTVSFKNVWGLIGQGHTEVNAVDMAMIAAAVVNGGETATPYIVSSVVNPNREDEVLYQAEPETKKLLEKKTADKTARFWEWAVDRYYYDNKDLNSRISHAKTGTAEQGDGNVDNLLMGVIESSKTAFYIVVEDGRYSNLPVTIANKLAELLPS